MRITDYRNNSGMQVTAQKGPEFVSNAFPVDRNNARYVSLARLVPTKQGWRSTTITKESGKRARRHVQRVHPPVGFNGSFRSCKGLRCDCDCDRYLYVWNYALNAEGLAVEDRTNGDAPVATNPNQKLGCCKHLILTLRQLWKDNPTFSGTAAKNASGTAGSVSLTTLRQALRNR
jgi:hypothetical protein